LSLPPQLGPVQFKAGFGNAGEHTHPSTMLAGERIARVTRVLQHLPADLDEQPFLRVHVDRIARRDIKKQRIEFIEAAHKTAPLAVAAIPRHRLIGIGTIKSVQRPALRRNLANAVAAIA
jgi:hypothetical protein